MEKFIFLILLTMCIRFSRGENTCPDNQLQCLSDNRCLPLRWKCDGIENCRDGSDELYCEPKVCRSYEMKCKSDYKCIPLKWNCDGQRDCRDGSDEMNCDYPCEIRNCSQKCQASVRRCYCNDGFELVKSDNRTCIDINECNIKDACSQICVNTQGSYRCACYDGYDIANGTCVKFGIEDSEFIYFSDGSNINIKKRKGGFEVVNPLPLSSQMVKITGLSFQPKTQVLYIADGGRPAIYAVNMTSLHVQELVTNHLSSPEDIAFDWMSDNLYWLDSEKGTAEVISVDMPKRIVLIEDLSNPVSLAISPYSGIMFIAEVGFESWISMFEMDGTGKRMLHPVQGMPMSLTLHPSETVLYWSDTSEEVISYVNYSRTSPPRTLKRVAGIMSVAVSQDKIIYTSEIVPQQSDRERGSTKEVHEVELQAYKKVKSWKSITYSYRMKSSMKSECLTENGGCSYLCLTSPRGRTCACSSGMKLDEDEQTCIAL